jgi:hypothetical protein
LIFLDGQNWLDCFCSAPTLDKYTAAGTDSAAPKVDRNQQNCHIGIVKDVLLFYRFQVGFFGDWRFDFNFYSVWIRKFQFWLVFYLNNWIILNERLLFRLFNFRLRAR